MGIVTDILKELPLSAILRERLTEAEAKMAALEKENAVLKAENAVLKAENQDLRVNLEKTTKERDDLANAPAPVHFAPIPGPRRGLVL